VIYFEIVHIEMICFEVLYFEIYLRWYILKWYVLRWYVLGLYTFSVPVTTTTRKMPEFIFWCLIFVLCVCVGAYTHFCTTCSIIFSTTNFFSAAKNSARVIWNYVVYSSSKISCQKSTPVFAGCFAGHTWKNANKWFTLPSKLLCRLV
jgi:hypothetical protein